MVKYLLFGFLLSIGWYIGHEFYEIVHRKIHSKCKNLTWYRKLYSQPTQLELQHKESTGTVIYGLRTPEKSI